MKAVGYASAAAFVLCGLTFLVTGQMTPLMIGALVASAVGIIAHAGWRGTQKRRGADPYQTASMSPTSLVGLFAVSLAAVLLIFQLILTMR